MQNKWQQSLKQIVMTKMGTAMNIVLDAELAISEN